MRLVILSHRSFELQRHHPDTALLVDGILTLAKKYQMDAIRKRIIKHIEADWPADLAEWNSFEEEIESKRKLVINEDDYLWRMLPEPVSAISLAKRHDIPRILPAACYHLARIEIKHDCSLPEKFIFNKMLAARWSQFSLEELIWFQDRAIDLMRMAEEAYFNCFEFFWEDESYREMPPHINGCYSTGQECFNTHLFIYNSIAREIFKKRDPLRIFKALHEADFFTNLELCKVCTKHYDEERYHRAQRDIWNYILLSFRM